MRVFLLLLISGALWAQTPAAPVKPAAPPVAGSAADPVVFAAGSTKMTKSEFETLVKNLPEQIRAQLGGDTPEAGAASPNSSAKSSCTPPRPRNANSTRRPRPRSSCSSRSRVSCRTALSAGAGGQQARGGCLQGMVRCAQRRLRGSQGPSHPDSLQGFTVPLKPNQQDLGEEEALARTKAIRERIVRGEDFAAVAKANLMTSAAALREAT